jgi:hypothetical protein
MSDPPDEKMAVDGETRIKSQSSLLRELLVLDVEDSDIEMLSQSIASETNEEDGEIDPDMCVECGDQVRSRMYSTNGRGRRCGVMSARSSIARSVTII